MDYVRLPHGKRCKVNGEHIWFDIDHHGGHDRTFDCYLIKVWARKSHWPDTQRALVFADCWPVGERAKKAFKDKRLSCKFLAKQYQEEKRAGRGLRGRRR